MDYLPFKAKGSPELKDVVSKFISKYSGRWCGDSSLCDYVFCPTNLTMERVERNCPKTRDFPIVSPEEFVSKILAYVNGTPINKNKIFIKGGEETKEVLITLLKLGLFKTYLETDTFSKEDRYFAIGSIKEGYITYSSVSDFYLSRGLVEITPSEARVLWFPKGAINNVYCAGSSEPKADSTHINMESPKNSKSFDLPQKQTLKIVL